MFHSNPFYFKLSSCKLSLPVFFFFLNIVSLTWSCFNLSCWQAEVNYLGQLHHENLVKLIGYSVEADNRLLVYEFMPKGSLENHLFRSKQLPPPFIFFGDILSMLSQIHFVDTLIIASQNRGCHWTCHANPGEDDFTNIPIYEFFGRRYRLLMKQMVINFTIDFGQHRYWKSLQLMCGWGTSAMEWNGIYPMWQKIGISRGIHSMTISYRHQTDSWNEPKSK